MRFFVMWHNEMKWGTAGTNGMPVLHKHKKDVTSVTGLTLRKLRELGWKWIEVVIAVPGEVQTKEQRLMEVNVLLQELTEERAELVQDLAYPRNKGTSELEEPLTRPPGASSDGHN